MSSASMMGRVDYANEHHRLAVEALETSKE